MKSSQTEIMLPCSTLRDCSDTLLSALQTVKEHYAIIRNIPRIHVCSSVIVAPPENLVFYFCVLSLHVKSY